MKLRLLHQVIGYSNYPFPRILEFVVMLLLGFLVFFFVCGWTILDPTNLAFLQSGDPAQHYLGWAFYRRSEINFPLGLNPLYGLEIGSSIVFSDSIPLIAIPLRFFNNYLPQPFQYFGLYILIIFLFQGYFAWKLAGIIVKRGDFQGAVIRLLVVALFLFSPPLLWRLTQHIALASHFLILAAIYLTLKPLPEFRTRNWLLLLSLAALIHFYIFVMVAMIFLATLLDNQFGLSSLRLRFVFWNLFVTAIVLGILMWQAGYFVGTSVLNTKWYGLGNLNLLALFDSNGWSAVLPDIPQTMGALNPKYLPGRVFDGFNYFGLGYLVLWIFAIPGLKNWKLIIELTRKHRYFVICVCLMMLFAITNQVSIGPHNFFIDIPEVVLKYAELLRSPARMFWPMFYALVFLAIYINIHYYSSRMLMLIFFGALLLQMVDISPGLRKLHYQYSVAKISQIQTNLKHSFWDQAALRYKNIIEVQPSMSWDYQNIAGYAVNYGLGTNAIYLARNDSLRLELAKQEWAEQVLGGQLNAKSLYLIDDRLLPLVIARKKSISDLLARIDGRNVLAPNWHSFSPGSIDNLELIPLRTNWVEPNLKITFGQSSYGRNFLAYGWANSEVWGTWSDSQKAKIILPLNFDNLSLANSIEINFNAFIDASHPEQKILVKVNQGAAWAYRLTKSENNRVIIPLDAQSFKNKLIELEFYFPDARRPEIMSFDSDQRLLAVGLVSLSLEKQ